MKFLATPLVVSAGDRWSSEGVWCGTGCEGALYQCKENYGSISSENGALWCTFLTYLNSLTVDGLNTKVGGVSPWGSHFSQ